MLIHTSKFGETEIEEEKILVFSKGILGFENINRFTIITKEEAEPIYWLQGIDEDVALPCINPFDFFPDYQPLIEDEQLEKIKAQRETPMLVLNTIVIREQPMYITTNLAAPIVINTQNNHGAQFVLQSSDYKVKEPLFKQKDGAECADTV